MSAPASTSAAPAGTPHQSAPADCKPDPEKAAVMAMELLKAAGWTQVIILGCVSGADDGDCRVAGRSSGTALALGKVLFSFLENMPDIKAGFTRAFLMHRAGQLDVTVVQATKTPEQEGPAQ